MDVIQHQDMPSPPAMRDERETGLLIADVAALTGVPPPQLRSWEQAGLLHPRRSPNAIRLYGIEDVARVRLIKRSLVKPGRRGSLRRLVAALADGTLAPAPQDYAGLTPAPAGPVPMTASQYWQAVVGAMTELVVVCDTGGRMTYANPALQSLLAPAAAPPLVRDAPIDRAPAAGTPTDAALPALLDVLPLRWAALTGTRHRDVALALRGPAGEALPTLWTVTPLRDGDGALHGAVGVGHIAPVELSQDGLDLAAHDLRSPVTNILGRLELARRALTALASGAPVTLDQQALGRLDQHLANAELSTLDLIRMMDTLLDAAAIASGALLQHLEPGGVELDLLARQAVAHAQLHTTRHVVTLEVDTAPLLVAGDRARLRQVLDNLLANAVKYAPDGGPITVRLEVAAAAMPLPNLPPHPLRDAGGAGSWVLVRVTDPGLGIPAEAVPHVFDRYWRAEGATRRLPGTGLGLYTCRAIVAAHGGHIWLERSVPAPDDGTEAVGWHGTVMALLLPLVEPAAPDAPGS